MVRILVCQSLQEWKLALFALNGAYLYTSQFESRILVDIWYQQVFQRHFSSVKGKVVANPLEMCKSPPRVVISLILF
jgi:hypothetical protein